MIKLLLSYFLLSTSCTALAATVKATIETNNPIQFIEKQQSSNNSTLSLQKSSQNTEEIIYFNNPEDTLVQQQYPILSSSASLKSFAKNFNDKYADNELIQKSLSILYDTKQAWNATDSQVNAYANELVFTLKLEQFMEKDTTYTAQQSANSNLYSKNISPSYQSYQSDDISAYQMQQAHANASADNSSELMHNYIASLFQISTVYYLIALYILFMLLIWAIKFSLRFFP